MRPWDGYYVNYTLGFKRSVSVSTDAAAVTIPSKSVDYEYSFWITTDIKMSDDWRLMAKRIF